MALLKRGPSFENLVLAVVLNGSIGFITGWIITGPSDPKRMSFAVTFALTLALLAGSSDYRRMTGRWQGLWADVISAALVVVVVFSLRGLVGSLFS